MQRTILYGVLFLLVAGAAGYLGMRVNRSLPQEIPPAPTSLFDADAWSDLIVEHGTSTSMQALTQAAAHENSGDQYHAARAFGEALWMSQGEKGLDTCLTALRYGCQHGFMIAAIVAEGEERAHSLNEWCLLQGPLTRQCQHGIGHGLTRYFGEGVAHLPRALAACAALPLTRYTNAIDSCMWGATMEYYDNHPPTSAPLTLSVCDVLERDYQSSCAFTAARWFRIHTKATDMNERYTIIGAACKTGTSREMRLACFAGAGAQATQSASFDPNTTRALCSTAASGDILGETACLRGALEQFQSARIPATHTCWWSHVMAGESTCTERDGFTDAGAEHQD